MIIYNRHICTVISLIFIYISAFGQHSDRFCKQSGLLISILEKKHYQPILVGEQLSDRAYRLFLQAIDPHGLYFIANDTNILALCKKNIIETTNNQNCTSTFAQIIHLYKQRLKEADSLISQLLQLPLNFSTNDSIYFGENKKMYFAKDREMLEKGWIRWLTYEGLLYFFSSDSTTDNPFKKSTQELLQKEPEVRNKIKVKEKRNIRRILEHPDGFENYVTSAFLNAIASSFDPHSSYFSPSEKRNFESSLSADALSYGFEVEDKPNGNVEISRLIPGGPAWKSNELHKGDILIQVHWPDGQTLDFSCSDQDEVEEILQSSGSNRMELTVKKPNGQLKTVTLIKKMLKSEDNLIKSYVLKGQKNIGYISLPGFYTQWENQDPIGCSNDMASEIIKLKQEHIEGIIIDLRNNGGGAMNEAIALAGTFIEGGPLCILSEKDRKLTLLRDMGLGNIYDGPLVLMVNGFSASASEIMTASLQDYHRAVIVGSPTFGKASGQAIFSLDSLSKTLTIDSRNKNSDGFVKITVSKFYRLNGISYQRKGVVPDVILPAYFEGFSYQEANQPYAFAADSLDRKAQYTPFPELPIKELSERSKARVAANERFKKISSTVDSLHIIMNQMKAIPINIEFFQKKEAWIFEALQLLEKEAELPSTVFTVANVKYDQLLNKLSTYKKEVNDILIKNMQNDIYIEETYLIANDLINYK